MNIDSLKWDESGLIPVVAQDQYTGQVRMVAYANRTALDLTLERREAHFFSRSRKTIWRKGEESGNTMAVTEVWVDCDGDALIYFVEPAGPTCHTGQQTCFFTRLDGHNDDQKTADPTMLRLWTTVESRRNADAAKSYTKALLDKGPVKIASKISEEGQELALAVREEGGKRVISESADVVYHMMVGLVARGVTWREVVELLAKRFGISGHDEKAGRVTMKP